VFTARYGLGVYVSYRLLSIIIFKIDIDKASFSKKKKNLFQANLI